MLKEKQQGKSKPIATRSELFLMSLQAQGLCFAMRQSFQSGDYGPKVVEFLSDLRDAFVEIATGDSIDRLYEVTPDLKNEELLVLAEVVAATIQAFLTPEEIMDQRETFGFHTCA